VTTQKDP
jgi:hypothetical protein